MTLLGHDCVKFLLNAALGFEWRVLLCGNHAFLICILNCNSCGSSCLPLGLACSKCLMKLKTRMWNDIARSPTDAAREFCCCSLQVCEEVGLWEFMQKDVWLYVHRSAEMSDLSPEIKGGFKSARKPNFTAVVCTESAHKRLQFYRRDAEGGVVRLSWTLLLEEIFVLLVHLGFRLWILVANQSFGFALLSFLGWFDACSHYLQCFPHRFNWTIYVCT